MKKLIKILMILIIYVILVLCVLAGVGVIKIKFINFNKKSADEYINNGLHLEDEELNKSSGKIDNFYYNQLDDTAKIIYDRILKEEKNLRSGTAQIEFKNHEFDNVLNKKNGMEILSGEYQNAVDSLRNDHVELFYIDFTKMSLKVTTTKTNSKLTYEVYLDKESGVKNYFRDNINSKQEVEAMFTEIKAIKETILPQITGTNYQKIYKLHNWLIDNIEYDQSNESENNRNIYGSLIEQKAVCEGYAKAFKYLLDELNIPCIIVAGYANNSAGNLERHMWNYVLINDIWYSVDVTWDDPIIINGGDLPDEHRYKYFCQGDNINKDHYIEKTITEGCQEYEFPELYKKENS